MCGHSAGSCMPTLSKMVPISGQANEPHKRQACSISRLGRVCVACLLIYVCVYILMLFISIRLPARDARIKASTKITTLARKDDNIAIVNAEAFEESVHVAPYDIVVCEKIRSLHCRLNSFEAHEIDRATELLLKSAARFQ